MKINDKDKYKLPKTRVVGPILAYTLIFTLVMGGILVISNLLKDYILNVRSEADMESIRSIAVLYGEGDENEREEILAMLRDQGRSYCIVNRKGKVLSSEGKITCEGYDKKSDSFTKLIISDFDSEIDKEIEDDEDVDELFSDISTDRSIRLDDTEADTSSVSFITGLGLKNTKRFLSDADYEVMIPYWVGTSLGDSSEILLVRSEISIRGKDYMYMAAGVIIAMVINLVVFILMISNVTNNLTANKKMKKMLFRDNIAPGRNWLWYVINCQEIMKKRRNSMKTYAVVELVFIKYRNYVLCHSVKEAESLLRQVAQTITAQLGKEELCAHSTSSGIPLLLEVENREDAEKRIRGIIESLEKIPCSHKLAFRAGVCLVTPSEEMIRQKTRQFTADVDLLYNNACAAGLSIADSGDSGIAFFDQKLVDEEKWIDTIIERQQAAVDNEEFLVYYQPKYDPRTDELMGAEALIRWKTEDMGLIPPFKFIPVFENNGFITSIDHYMVSHVARDQKKWLDEGKKCVPVSVNISRAHFAESNLSDQICEMVDKEGTPHELIEIELTESAFFDDKNAMIDTINKLKSHGFLVSMDDFGSGYSSLNSLKDMPLDILKLDAGFFRGQTEDNSRTEIVVSEAIRLAKSLNMKTVAEGVEEKAQVDFLASEGCDMIQGYYYAKPMPKEEFEARISSAPVAEEEESSDDQQ